MARSEDRRSQGGRARRAWLGRHPWLGALGGLLTAILVLAVIWDWNWFRGLAEREASQRLGRPVTIGHLGVDPSWTPRITLDRVEIGNPPDVPLPEPTMTIDRLMVGIDLRKLLDGTLRLPAIVIEKPRGYLARSDAGKANWEVHSGAEQKPASAPSQSFPEIGRLEIIDGRIRFIDPKTKADLDVAIHTEPGGASGAGSLIADGEGRYNGAKATLSYRGDSVLSLRDQDRPYQLTASADFGGTKSALEGTVARPLELGGFEFNFHLSGPDMAGLYPLTGIAVPPTPPYDLRGRLTFVGHAYRFSGFEGRLGESDIGGDFAYEPAHGDNTRPKLTGNLVSKKLRLADLGGFVGEVPGTGDTAGQTRERKQELKQAKSDKRLLPDTKIDFEKLNAMDADVTLKATRIEGSFTPLDDIQGHLVLDNGVLVLKPLTFGVGRGSIVANLELDGRRQPAGLEADIDFRKVDFSRLMKETRAFQGFGTIGGSATLVSRGNSTASFLGNGSGKIALFMAGGQVSQLLTELGEIDIQNALGLATGVQEGEKPPENTGIRCLVDQMTMREGVLKIDTFVFDTTVSLFTIEGTANMKTEALDMRLVPHPKEPSVLTFRPPILIRGSFADPSVYPEPSSTAARVGATIALGILATPLGALLPSIELGLGEDAPCSDLVRKAAATAKNARNVNPAASSLPAPVEGASGARDGQSKGAGGKSHLGTKGGEG